MMDLNDDLFDDDILDTLTESRLNDLEQQAILATQAQASQAPQPLPSRYNPVAPLSKLNYRTSIAALQRDNSSSLKSSDVNPPFRPPFVQNAVTTATLSAMRAPPVPRMSMAPTVNPGRPQASQYQRPQPTQFNRPAAASQSQGHQRFFHNRLPGSQSVNPPFQPVRSSQIPSFRPATSTQTAYQLSFAVPPATQQSEVSGGEVAELQARLFELQKRLNETKGEASILRNRLGHVEKEHAEALRQITTGYEQTVQKYKAMLESAQTTAKTTETELRFLQQEARDAATSARVRAAVTAVTAPKVPGGPQTPQKAQKTWKMADGFDDFDLATTSPKRLGGRSSSGLSLEHTPTKGKRKRGVHKNPGLILETDDVVMGGGEGAPAIELAKEVVPSRTAGTTGNREVKVAAPAARRQVPVPIASYDYINILLDHQPHPEPSPSTLQALFQVSFSSMGNQTAAASILHLLPQFSAKTQPLQALADLAHHLALLLGTAVDEENATAFAPLAEMLAFALRLHSFSLVRHLVPNLVPTITAALTTLLQRRRTPQSLQAARSLLALMHLAAVAVSPASNRPDQPPGANKRSFWFLVTRDVVAFCLSPLHATPSEAIVMLRILSLSVTERSLGPICNDISVKEVAALMIQDVSRLLEVPGIDSFSNIGTRLGPLGSCHYQHQPYQSHHNSNNNNKSNHDNGNGNNNDNDVITIIRKLHAEALNTLASFAKSLLGRNEILNGKAPVLQRVVATLISAVAAIYSVGGRCAYTLYPSVTDKTPSFADTNRPLIRHIIVMSLKVLAALVISDPPVPFPISRRLSHSRPLIDGLVISLGRLAAPVEGGFFAPGDHDDDGDNNDDENHDGGSIVGELAAGILEVVCSDAEWRDIEGVFGFVDEEGTMQVEAEAEMDVVIREGRI